MNIKTITVVGADGTVGRVISGIFASFGNAKVYMVGLSKEKLQMAKKEAALSVKATTIEDKLQIASMDELEKCVNASDLVFESVVENLDIKKEIHRRINNSASENCIMATGTSGLSIDELSECYDERKKVNFYGIHFFNPPYSLTLCELIPSKYNWNNSNDIIKIKTYLIIFFSIFIDIVNNCFMDI